MFRLHIPLYCPKSSCCIAIGGLKEKVLAAHRAGIKKIVLPRAVKADFEYNVAESSKEGIEICYVDDVREVLKIAFEGREVASLADHLPVASQAEVGSIVSGTTT